MDIIKPSAEQLANHVKRTGRPFVTLSYAQTLDGCLTLRAGQSSPVSGPESKRITHAIRAAHDSILVGIGTVLADNPRLTVRLVEGPDPQPIVLDSRLRFPPDARLLNHPHDVWIATTEPSDPERAADLEEKGARILTFPPDEHRQIPLDQLLNQLAAEGIKSLMVEGGAQVITSFLRARMVDRAAITVAPVLAGGYRAIRAMGIDRWDLLPRLKNVTTRMEGEDIMIWGDLA